MIVAFAPSLIAAATTASAAAVTLAGGAMATGVSGVASILSGFGLFALTTIASSLTDNSPQVGAEVR